jgi:hypothetical protein
MWQHGQTAIAEKKVKSNIDEVAGVTDVEQVESSVLHSITSMLRTRLLTHAMLITREIVLRKAALSQL